MTAAKHSPGPWKADLCLDGWGIHEVQRADGLSIARLAQMQTAFAPDDQEGIANALLIAAAPDLLKALSAMLTHMGMDEDEWNKPTFDQARAAIAKATGGDA